MRFLGWAAKKRGSTLTDGSEDDLIIGSDYQKEILEAAGYYSSKTPKEPPAHVPLSKTWAGVSLSLSDVFKLKKDPSKVNL
jgi:hypothetical protein